MKDPTGKENQNIVQTPSPEYHSSDNDFITELVRKVTEEMRATNTPILSYEPPDSPVWISDFLLSLHWQ